jgi:hypothetical protein
MQVTQSRLSHAPGNIEREERRKCVETRGITLMIEGFLFFGEPDEEREEWRAWRRSETPSPHSLLGPKPETLQLVMDASSYKRLTIYPFFFVTQQKEDYFRPSRLQWSTRNVSSIVGEHRPSSLLLYMVNIESRNLPTASATELFLLLITSSQGRLRTWIGRLTHPAVPMSLQATAVAWDCIPQSLVTRQGLTPAT